MNKTEYFENSGDHADEMETSLILHLRPELVLPAKEWGHGVEKINKIKAFSEDWAWTERPWSKITQDTGVGNPHASSKEKGERFFDDVCAKMSRIMVDIAHADMDDLYV
jgi:creatinine amidohydrolase